MGLNLSQGLSLSEPDPQVAEANQIKDLVEKINQAWMTGSCLTGECNIRVPLELSTSLLVVQKAIRRFTQGHGIDMKQVYVSWDDLTIRLCSRSAIR